MRRFLLALLIVCLALPAVAVEACAPPVRDAATAMHGHHTPAPADQEQAPEQAAQHGCIGCVPPLAAPGGAAEERLAARPFAAEPPALDISPAYPPVPPPPRFRA